MSGAPGGYQPHIDGLRAIAVASVVLYHLMPQALPGGYVGVDVFFVISGFLITRIIVREAETGRFSLQRFYERRARRILPALGLVAAITTAAAWFLLPPNELALYGRSLLGTALFTSNLHFESQSGYFDGAAQSKPLLHTWSLAVEEQFYLLWPLVVMGVARLASRRAGADALRPALAWTIGITCLASLAAAEVVVRREPASAFFLTPFRAWELGIGALLALVDLRRTERLRPWVRSGAALAGLALVAGSVGLMSPASLVPGVAALGPTLGAALLVACGAAGPVGRLLASPPMVGLGLVSYPVYLWHWPILAFIHAETGRGPQGLEAAAVVALVLALSVLTTRFVERPIRAGTASLPWRPLAVAAAGLVLAAGVGRVLQLDRGWPSRLDPAARAAYETMASRHPLRRRCHGLRNAMVDDPACNIGAPKAEGASYDLVIIGDSQADHWVPLLADYARRRGWSARQITQENCAPVFGARRHSEPPATNELCARFHEAARTFVARHPGLRQVVLAGNWPDFADGAIGDDGRAVDPRAAAEADRVGTRGTLAWHVAATVAELRRADTETILIGPFAYLPAFTPRCVVSAATAGTWSGACGAVRADVEAATGHAAAALGRLAAADPRLRLVHPVEAVCGTGACSPWADGLPLYHDPGHLNAFGAMELGRRMGLIPDVPQTYLGAPLARGRAPG